MSDSARTPGTPGMVSLSQDTGTDAYDAGLPPRAPRFAAEREASSARAHPYSPRTRSPASDSGGDDEFFITMTQ